MITFAVYIIHRLSPGRDVFGVGQQLQSIIGKSLAFAAFHARERYGASMLMLVDVSDPNHSKAINTKE